MSKKVLLSLNFSSMSKQVDIPLEERDYTFEEVRELLGIFASSVNICIFEHFQKEMYQIANFEEKFKKIKDIINRL